MTDDLKYQLLKIIHHNGNIWELINGGYEFGQVSYFIDSLKTDNYIFTTTEGKTQLTEAGAAYITGFETNNKIEIHSKWILPRREMWHSPVSDSYIYIPKG